MKEISLLLIHLLTVVARLLGPGGNAPSWLTFLGHMKGRVWSVDLFRCESTILRSHWVLVVMDQRSRRIIGFAVYAGDVNGVILCRMFNQVITGNTTPTYLSSDNDPLFEYHRWQANLLEVLPDPLCL